MPYLDELRERLRLEAFDIIDEIWYNDLVTYLEAIEKEGAVDYVGYVHSDLIPDKDALYNIGIQNLRFRSVNAVYGYFYRVDSDLIFFHNIFGDEANIDRINSDWGYFSNNVYVQGKRVLKDEDPIYISAFYDYAKSQLEDAVLNAILRWSPPPLLMNDRAVVTALRIEERIEDGKGFRASFRYDGLADGATTNILIQNPDGSGVEVHVILVEVVTGGSGAIDVYKDVEVTTLGSEIPKVNLNFGSDRIPNAVVTRDNSYTGGELIGQTMVFGGTVGGKGGVAVGGLMDVGEKVIIPPGHNILVVFENRAGTDVDVAMRVLWFEDEIT